MTTHSSSSFHALYDGHGFEGFKAIFKNDREPYLKYFGSYFN